MKSKRYYNHPSVSYYVKLYIFRISLQCAWDKQGSRPRPMAHWRYLFVKHLADLTDQEKTIALTPTEEDEGNQATQPFEEEEKVHNTIDIFDRNNISNHSSSSDSDVPGSPSPSPPPKSKKRSPPSKKSPSKTTKREKQTTKKPAAPSSQDSGNIYYHY